MLIKVRYTKAEIKGNIELAEFMKSRAEKEIEDMMKMRHLTRQYRNAIIKKCIDRIEKHEKEIARLKEILEII